MPVTGEEIRPRSLTLDGAKRVYYLEGAEDEDDVADWLTNNLPATVAGFPLADYSATENDKIAGDYEVEVNWGVPEFGASQEIETAAFEFSYQAPGGHIMQSLSTIAAYKVPATPDTNPPAIGGAGTAAIASDLFKGAINVVSDSGKGYRVEGLNLTPPTEVFKLRYRASASQITGAYQDLVLALCGKVNSTTFRGKAAGSVMLVRANGGRDAQGSWSIDFGFGYIPNSTSTIMVGDIPVAGKEGFDLLWAFYGHSKVSNANGWIKSPTYAFVERVFERADLNQLNLPS